MLLSLILAKEESNVDQKWSRFDLNRRFL